MAPRRSESTKGQQWKFGKGAVETGALLGALLGKGLSWGLRAQQVTMEGWRALWGLMAIREPGSTEGHYGRLGKNCKGQGFSGGLGALKVTMED